MSEPVGNFPGRTKIESWKEIASFFNRDERTVKRWEKTRLLPVHRFPGAKSGVFAYSDELVEWLDSRSKESLFPRDDGSAAALAEATGSEQSAATQFRPEGRTPSAAFARARLRRRELLWFSSLAGLLFIAVFTSHRLHTLRNGSAEPVPLVSQAAAARSDTSASELYLRGRYYWSHRTEANLRQAVDVFSQAIARDPKYARAYAGLADTYDLMPEYTGMPEAKAFPIAIQAARQAIALDDSLAEAHRALGFGLFFREWDADQAFTEFRRAAQLDPGDEDVHCWFAHALFILGQYAEAKAEIERARQIDPTSRSVLATQGLIRAWAGEREAGIAQLEELETAEPDYSAPARYLALIHFKDRNYPAYIEQLRRHAALTRKPFDTALASAADAGWKHGGERGLLEDMRDVYLRSLQSGEASGFDLAIVCARLGRRHEADHYLQALIDARDHHAMRVLRGDLDAEMQGDERFEQLKRAIQQRVKFTVSAGAAK